MRPIALAVLEASSAFSELTTMPASLGLGGVEAVGVAGNERLDHGRAGLERLDEHAARLGAAPGDLRDLPETAFGRAQIAARLAEIGVDYADERQVGDVMAPVTSCVAITMQNLVCPAR